MCPDGNLAQGGEPATAGIYHRHAVRIDGELLMVVAVEGDVTLDSWTVRSN